jgi:hypothetical protein
MKIPIVNLIGFPIRFIAIFPFLVIITALIIILKPNEARNFMRFSWDLTLNGLY